MNHFFVLNIVLKELKQEKAELGLEVILTFDGQKDLVHDLHDVESVFTQTGPVKLFLGTKMIRNGTDVTICLLADGTNAHAIEAMLSKELLGLLENLVFGTYSGLAFL